MVSRVKDDDYHADHHTMNIKINRLTHQGWCRPPLRQKLLEAEIELYALLSILRIIWILWRLWIHICLICKVMDHWVIWDVRHSCLDVQCWLFLSISGKYFHLVYDVRKELVAEAILPKESKFNFEVSSHQQQHGCPARERGSSGNLCCPIVGLTAVEEAGPKGDNVESFSNLGNCVMTECPVLVMTSMTMTMTMNYWPVEDTSQPWVCRRRDLKHSCKAPRCPSAHPAAWPTWRWQRCQRWQWQQWRWQRRHFKGLKL